MKKFFSLVLALVMALSLTTAAWGVSVADATAAQAALDAATGDLTLTLTGDVTTPLVVDFRATLDYDEATPDYSVGSNPYYIATRNMGNVTVVGDGTTKFAGFQFVSNLTHENHHVDPASRFVIGTLTIQDVVFEAKPDLATGGIGAAAIDTLIFDGVTFEAGAYISNSAIENVVFVDCAFTGGVSAIEVTGADSDINVTVVGCEFENVDRAVLLSGGSYAGDVAIVNNEMSCAKYAVRITTLAADATLTVKDNTATVASGTAIKVDTIATDSVEAIGNNWGGATVPAAFADSASSLNGTTGVYAKGTYAGATAEAATVKYYKAVDNKVNKDGTWKANGTVEYYTLSCDTMKYAKVNTLGEADVAVYTDAACKNAYLYLKAIDVVYYGDGAVFTNFGDMCGQYDEDDTDYDDEATYYTAFNTLYVGVEPGAGYGYQLMVNGQLVKVDAVNNITKLAHKALVTTDKKGAITSVECPVCGLAAVKAGNYASIPAAVVAANLVVTGPDAAGAYWYFPVATAGATTDVKVESAETFDAGIAMYVGMSVMAAAGSAVVLKKREG